MKGWGLGLVLGEINREPIEVKSNLMFVVRQATNPRSLFVEINTENNLNQFLQEMRGLIGELCRGWAGCQFVGEQQEKMLMGVETQLLLLLLMSKLKMPGDEM